MKKNKFADKDRCEHILKSIAFLEKYTNGLEEEDFLRDEVLKRAVVREFEIIGEASNYLSDELKSNSKEIKWPKIISLRNRLIHKYMEVNYRTVWEILIDEISTLKKNIELILLNL